MRRLFELGIAHDSAQSEFLPPTSVSRRGPRRYLGLSPLHPCPIPARKFALASFPALVSGRVRGSGAEWRPVAQGVGGELGAGSAFIEPGLPWQNPYVESFGFTIRDELLGVELFSCLSEAQVVIEDWRRDDNTHRPHSASDLGEHRARELLGEDVLDPDRRCALHRCIHGRRHPP